MRYLIIVVLVLLAACARVPKGIEPVTSFSVKPYLGTWYEIARLDHGFEDGLSHVTAEYTLNGDGSIEVRNIGYSAITHKWEEAVGKAKFVDGDDVGHLKVAFQWPFYSSYIIFRLDKDYSIAYVAGDSRKYLWLLARDKTVSTDVLADFKATAEAKGFDSDKLILVDQTPLD